MEAPKLPSLFRGNRPRKFQFYSRYHNPSKEKSDIPSKENLLPDHLQQRKLEKTRVFQRRLIIFLILIIGLLLYLKFV